MNRGGGPFLGPVSAGAAQSATPIPPPPTSGTQGVFANTADGTGTSADCIPVLPNATTPGRLLVAITALVTQSPAIYFPSAVVYSASAAAWTKIGGSCVDYSGMNTGGPCGIPFGANCTTPCTNGAYVEIGYRFVTGGEVTTTPTNFQAQTTSIRKAVWLWEIPTASAPSGEVDLSSNPTAANNTCTGVFPTLSGNLVGIMLWATKLGHGNVPTPNGLTINTGKLLQGVGLDNNPAVPGASQQQPVVYIQTLAAGGIMSSTMEAGDPGATDYNFINYCCVATALPAGIVLPSIPYPTNNVVAP